MDRTVPKTGSEDIELYMRTYYSLLRSTEAVQIATLEESHKAMESSLHPHARDTAPDISALTYSTLRLPSVLPDTHSILIGQIERSFTEEGYAIETWERVYSPGRRRRNHYNGDGLLAVFIASRSDIDDLVPMLTAYQIEWNKIHDLLRGEVARLFLAQNENREHTLSDGEAELLAQVLHLSTEDVRRLEAIWHPHFISTLQKIAKNRKRLTLKLLASSMAAYRKATVYWWEEIQAEALKNGVDPRERPVYFVSSNTHAIPNLLTGYAWRHENDLIAHIQEKEQADLMAEYTAILNQNRATNLNNFLYYVLKKYFADHPNAEEQMTQDEQRVGIYRVPNKHGFQIPAQIIELNKLSADWLDSRLYDDAIDRDALARSNALIINIDYPLGLAAYEICNRVTERSGQLRGVYVMGKAATLNGRIGDVMIPNVIHDEHSRNTYLFHNCFVATDVAPYMAYGMVLDNQKAISAPGTFLQNPRYMDVFYQEGYTDIEMEGGPYLSSIYEAYRPNRHPQNEIVNLHEVAFDVGFLHYASDTPFGRGHNLGTSNLSYTGIDPTYATAIAILRRILREEIRRVQAKQSVK